MGTNWISTNCKEIKCRSTQRGKRHANRFHRLWFSLGLQRLTQLVSVTAGEVSFERSKTGFNTGRGTFLGRLLNLFFRKHDKKDFDSPAGKKKFKKTRLWLNYFFFKLSFFFSPEVLQVHFSPTGIPGGNLVQSSNLIMKSSAKVHFTQGWSSLHHTHYTQNCTTEHQKSQLMAYAACSIYKQILH